MQERRRLREMMGRKSAARKLFYDFSLEERVPRDHFLRRLTQVVDFSFVYDMVKPYYSHTGTPSVDPVVVFKMALIGYLYNIPSERRLAEEVRLNLAFLWFLGYDIDETPPDHSILSKCRKRFGKEVYEAFFRKVLDICRNAGLVEGDRVYLDATLLKANASFESLVSKSLYRQLPDAREFVDNMWDENEPEGEKTNQVTVSRTDPDCSIIRTKQKGTFLAHKVHLAVDAGESRIITAVAVTPGAEAEYKQVPFLVGMHTFNCRKKPREVVADRGYGKQSVYVFLHKQGIIPIIPRHRTRKTRIRKKQDLGFTYDPKDDVYICPRGKKLYKVQQIGETICYRAHRYACRGCDMQPDCGAQRASITRMSETIESALAVLQSSTGKRAMAQRKCWVETVNADLKNNRSLCQAYYCGNTAVTIQALLAACAHNIFQLVKARFKKCQDSLAVLALPRLERGQAYAT